MSSVTRSSLFGPPPPYQSSYGTMEPPSEEKSREPGSQPTSYQSSSWQAVPLASQVWQLPEGTYQGAIKSGYPHGKGKLIYTENNERGRKEYAGDFQDGLPSGQGKMIWDNGDVYEGRWHKGEMHGKGLRTYTEEREVGSYDGDWCNGQMHGQGVRTWEDPDIQFTGLFENGEQVRGTQRGPGNEIWTGEWRNGTFFAGTKDWVEEGHRQTEIFVNGSPEQPGCCVLV